MSNLSIDLERLEKRKSLLDESGSQKMVLSQNGVNGVSKLNLKNRRTRLNRLSVNAIGEIKPNKQNN